MSEHFKCGVPEPAEVIFAPSNEASVQLTAQYLSGFRRAFLKHSQNFSWIEPTSLPQRDRVLAILRQNGEATAGLYYDRVNLEGIPAIYIKGLFSNSNSRGVGHELIASAFAYERKHRDTRFAGFATVRIREDGTVNPGAAVVFSRLGFVPRTREIVDISANERDRHLISTANINDDQRCAFEVLHLFCPPSQVARLADGHQISLGNAA